MDAKCKTPCARSLFSWSRWVIQSTTVSSSPPIFCVSAISFAEVPFHQIESYRTLTSTFCLGIITENRAHVHQARCCCCCCCCCCWSALLEALLEAPCASSILPAVRRLHQSFRSPVPSSVLQVTVVQVAVAQAVAQAATPNRCYCYLLLRATSLALGRLILERRVLAPVVRDFRWSST